jgi:hypothetical protein
VISIVVITPDIAVSHAIRLAKNSLIPRDLRIKYPNISMVSLLAEGSTNLQSLSSYFTARAARVTGAIILCDNRLGPLVGPLGSSLFTVIIDHNFGGKNLHNYFGMILSKVIRAFATFAERFDNEKYRKLLILPLRNFHSHELKELHLLFRAGVRADGNFSNILDEILKRLRERQKPKVESSYSATYIVDDDHRYFEYGKEAHCRLETGCPPHGPLCAVTGVYRFGKRYDTDRHFNVSLEREQQISGAFVDCHGVRAYRTPRSHLNMFPNDFFGSN